MKPTEKQTKAIENLGLPTPPTQAAARRLIEYIKKGTRTQGRTFQERIAVAHYYHNKWVDAKVRTTEDYWQDMTGKVLYLLALSPQEAKSTRYFTRSDSPAPFKAFVKPDNRELPRAILLRFLKIIN